MQRFLKIVLHYSQGMRIPYMLKKFVLPAQTPRKLNDKYKRRMSCHCILILFSLTIFNFPCFFQETKSQFSRIIDAVSLHLINIYFQAERYLSNLPETFINIHFAQTGRVGDISVPDISHPQKFHPQYTFLIVKICICNTSLPTHCLSQSSPFWRPSSSMLWHDQCACLSFPSVQP